MLKRIVLPGVVLVAGYYAVFGGEYTALDVHAVKGDTRSALETLDELGATTDSLRARADSLEHDDRALETLARERFGLIRDGEVLYRIVAPRAGLDTGGGPR